MSALERKMNCSKVLIVEDDAATREILREQIEALGVKCLEASDGIEALDMVRKETPSLMILDLGLPLLNGLDVVNTLRQEEKLELPLLV
jgi:two-component system alkaline phosphatase synthesis response regulator PhoP